MSTTTLLAPDDTAASAGLRMAPLRPEELLALHTPAYVFDPATIRARWRALRQALGTELVVSLKANSLVDLLLRCGEIFADGIELASIGELEIALPRVRATRYVNNPSMDEAFMKAAHVSGSVFIVDSLAQAERLAALPPARQRTRVLLRLAVGAWRGLADADHFGMLPEDAIAAARMLHAAGAELLGVHAFNGSHRWQRDGVAHAQALLKMLGQIEEATSLHLARVNLGGGFAEDWEDQPEAMARYVAALAPLAQGRQLMHESGRGIFGRAGAFVTRVVATKRLGGTEVVVCDGGMAQAFLLASTESIVKQQRAPSLVPPRATGDAPAELRFVGSSCSRQDVIGRIGASLQRPQPGDTCVFDGCGAYHSSYTVTPFLRLPAARLYLRAEPV